MIAQAVSGKLDFIVFPRINMRKIWIAGFIITIALLMFYIFQISNVTRAGFLVYKHEREIAVISQQARDLEAGLLAENSLSNMESLLEGPNYEKVSKVYYIQAMNDGMAIKHEKLAD